MDKRHWEKSGYQSNLNVQIQLIVQIDGETVETVAEFIFLGSKTLQMVTAAMKLKDACSLEGKLWLTLTAY